MADRLVVDASVAVKWFLKDSLETDTDVADTFLNACLAGELELFAPRIIIYEVCGVFTRACLTRIPGTSTPRMTKDYATQCIRDFLDFPIQIKDLGADELVSALESAVKFNKTHWDMTYVGLAASLGCEWLTADEKFFAAFPPGFPTHLVLRLANFRQP